MSETTWKDSLEQKLRQREFGAEVIKELIGYASSTRFYMMLAKTDIRYIEAARTYVRKYTALHKQEEERVREMKEMELWK